MAAKKNEGAPRGAELMKKVIEAARKGDISHPRPVPPAVLKRMTLPSGEPLSPSLRELLAFDVSWLGASYNDEDAEFDTCSLEELVEQEIDEEAVPLFSEAYGILDEDCIALDTGSEERRFLYVGTCDDAGEYPVITVSNEDGPWVGGFVPFDIWVAQQLGVLPGADRHGAVPPEYAASVKELATRNGDGRVAFVPKRTP